MPRLSFDVEIIIYDNCLIFQPCREWACGTQRERELAAKLVGHIDRSNKHAQQLDKLRDEVHSLDVTLWRKCMNYCSLAEMLHEKLEEKDSLTKL